MLSVFEKTAWAHAPETRLGGVTMTTASRPELLDLLARDQALVVAEGRRAPRTVFDANAQGLSLYACDPNFRAALQQADLVHADGGFLVTLSRYLGSARIQGRSCTTDMFTDIAAVAAEQGWSMYLLGATEPVNADCAAYLERTYPGLRIAGRHHGFFLSNGIDNVVADIERCAPDIIWVGLGKPIEQIVSIELARRVTATWLITCGGCFNYVVGGYPRAPRWMQHANLEWLHRLWCDPKRLGRRYLTTNPHALWLVAIDAMRTSSARRSA